MTTTTATGPVLSPDQQTAHDAIIAWYAARKNKLLTLGGYAGTGKTTMSAAVTATLRRQYRAKGIRIAFACFTGKASTILKAKLQRVNALQNDYCGTIHGLIYKPETDDSGRIVRWVRSPEIEADLIILDEASMVDGVLFADLQSYKIPILAVGDHGQLPPIMGAFNLMANPEIRLEKIHRQALDNPIVRAAQQVRETGHLPYCDWEGKVQKVTWGTSLIGGLLDKSQLQDTLFICGTNRTRVMLNGKIRTHLGQTKPEPQVGETVICLRNDRKEGLFNGLTGIIKEIEQTTNNFYFAKIKMDDGASFLGRINRLQFNRPTTLKGTEIPGLDRREYGQLFDFGYAMTCHKAQGSEAKTVVVYEECDWMETEDLRRRWLYTAYTRAAERLIVVGK